MEAVQIKKAWATVKFHAKIAWKGFYRTLYGAAVAGLIAFKGFITDFYVMVLGGGIGKHGKGMPVAAS